MSLQEAISLVMSVHTIGALAILMCLLIIFYLVKKPQPIKKKRSATQKAVGQKATTPSKRSDTTASSLTGSGIKKQKVSIPGSVPKKKQQAATSNATAVAKKSAKSSSDQPSTGAAKKTNSVSKSGKKSPSSAKEPEVKKSKQLQQNTTDNAPSKTLKSSTKIDEDAGWITVSAKKKARSPKEKASQVDVSDSNVSKQNSNTVPRLRQTARRSRVQ